MRRSLTALSVLFVILALTVGCRNKPPYTPDKPRGLSAVPRDSLVEYSSFTTDPNRDKILYIFDWADGKYDTSSYLTSGDTARKSHAWTDTGLFPVRVNAKDAKGMFSRAWSDTLLVRVYSDGANRRPNAPATPTGPDTGWVVDYHTFSTSATDPDGDSVRIRFIWGEDGRVSNWSNLVGSGVAVSDSAQYFYRGAKNVRAVAMDKDGLVSDTSAAKVFYANQTNTPPGKPLVTGPNRGVLNGPRYRFNAVADDPQRDNLQYKFFWGDGNSSDWTSLNPSGAIVMDSWRYAALGSYNIKAIARDEYGLVSDTSDAKPFEVVGEGRIVWSRMFGDEIFSSPALSDVLNARGHTRRAVVLGITTGSLVAVDAWQGEMLYDIFEDNNEPYLSSPAVGLNNTVYIGNGNGKVFAYDRTGDLKWGFPDTMSGDDMYASPLVDGQFIYVGGEDRRITKLRDDGDRATVVWSYALREEMISSPVMDGNGNVIVCDDSGYVYSFAPDNSLRWTFATFNNITSSPAVGPDNTVYFGTEQGRVYAVKNDGQRAWPPFEIDPPGIISSSPVIAADGSFYFGGDNGYLYRYTSAGQPVPGWPIQLCISDVSSTPALCADGIIYVSADNDTLYAVRENGTIAWATGLREDGKPSRPRGPRRAGVDDLLPSPVIDQHGIIYIACSFDGLYAIAGRPTGTLANTAWPMFRRDVKHTGKYAGW